MQQIINRVERVGGSRLRRDRIELYPADRRGPVTSPAFGGVNLEACGAPGRQLERVGGIEPP